MDFTLNKYRQLLTELVRHGYQIVTYESYLTCPPDGKFVILRHDVDELANHALKMAQLENNIGLKATYYFRTVRQSNDPAIIREIASLGHEIGYHYEDLVLAEGNYEVAINSFCNNLNYFRGYYPVKTVCMHGSSTSKFDNRLLWEKYSLSDYNLLGEPYLTTDFNMIHYLTDTGYAWDGGKFAVRDVVENRLHLTFHSTDQIIECIKKGVFPHQVMILAHTLWTDSISEWLLLHIREYLRNRIKLLARNNRLISNIYKHIVSLYWRQS